MKTYTTYEHDQAYAAAVRLVHMAFGTMALEGQQPCEKTRQEMIERSTWEFLTGHKPWRPYKTLRRAAQRKVKRRKYQNCGYCGGEGWRCDVTVGAFMGKYADWPCCVKRCTKCRRVDYLV